MLKEDQGLLWYTEGKSTASIEARLLDISRELPHVTDELAKNVLADERSLLLKKLEFIRDNWKRRFIWNILMPIVVSLVTTVLTVIVSTYLIPTITSNNVP